MPHYEAKVDPETGGNVVVNMRVPLKRNYGDVLQRYQIVALCPDQGGAKMTARALNMAEALGELLAVQTYNPEATIKVAQVRKILLDANRF